jgi:serine-type D-Ala-D-Ala carboxypeptidase (penicillin-binding protein 5/6)
VPALKKTVMTTLTAAVLSGMTVSPSWASGRPDPSGAQEPPAQMSTIGGARLGKPGTQVRTAAGVPALPQGITGRSWIVSDLRTGDVLAAHNAHWRLPPASTLKMLFADTLMAKLPSTKQHRVVGSDLAGMGAGSSLVGVQENQTYSVHDLWLGVFLRSGNDAVHVLSSMYGGVPRTVQGMQAEAADLRALDTHVVTPDGYDEPGQVSSAYDLSLFAREGLQNKDFRAYCSTAAAQFPGVRGKKGKKDAGFRIENTDRLLTGADGVTPYRGLLGVKNGYTTNAGNTFTGVAERDGHQVLVTVMNPSSHELNAVYKESASLLNWGFAAEGKVAPVGELVPSKAQEAKTSQADAAHAKSQAAPAEADASAKDGRGSAVGTALAIVAGALVLLAAGAFFVNRRWPLNRRP